MVFEISDEHRMLKDLVRKLVDDQLTPLEAGVLALHLTAAEKERIGAVSRELGLWGLDAPEDIGGDDLPTAAMVGVNEALGRTIIPYTLRPDSPNLRMLMATVTDRQRSVYLEPNVRGETVSAVAISEPRAGGDPAGIITRAERARDDQPQLQLGPLLRRGAGVLFQADRGHQRQRRLQAHRQAVDLQGVGQEPDQQLPDRRRAVRPDGGIRVGSVPRDRRHRRVRLLASSKARIRMTLGTAETPNGYRSIIRSTAVGETGRNSSRDGRDNRVRGVVNGQDHLH
jgi:hypothetical protein